MKILRFFLAVFAVFIIYEFLSYVIHSLLLSECYKELAPVWRADMEYLMWMIYVVDFLFSLFFVLIYSRWSKKYTIKTGLLFGLLVGVMMNTTSMISQWIIYPITNHLMVLWVVFGLVQFLICGFVLGLSYKPKK